MISIQPSIYPAFLENVRKECHVAPIDQDRLLAWSHEGHLTVMNIFGEIEQQTKVDQTLFTAFVIDATSIALVTCQIRVLLFKDGQVVEDISSTKSGVQSKTIQQIPEGLMWLTNKGSVVTYKSGKISKNKVSRKFLKRGEKPTAIALDHEQKLIIGTSKGRVVYQGKSYDEALGASGGIVSLQAFHDNHVAVKVSKGFFILSPDGLLRSSMSAEFACESTLSDRFIVHRTSSFNRTRSPYEVWNLQEDSEPVILEDTRYVRGVGAAFVDENHVVGAIGYREHLSLWKADTGSKIATIFHPRRFHFISCFSRANGLVAGGTSDGNLFVADVSAIIS